jgi:hypothetical protein
VKHLTLERKRLKESRNLGIMSHQGTDSRLPNCRSNGGRSNMISLLRWRNHHQSCLMKKFVPPTKDQCRKVCKGEKRNARMQDLKGRDIRAFMDNDAMPVVEEEGLSSGKKHH